MKCANLITYRVLDRKKNTCAIPKFLFWKCEMLQNCYSCPFFLTIFVVFLDPQIMLTNVSELYIYIFQIATITKETEKEESFEMFTKLRLFFPKYPGLGITTRSTTSQLYHGISFIYGGNRRKPLTCRKSLTNFIT